MPESSPSHLPPPPRCRMPVIPADSRTSPPSHPPPHLLPDPSPMCFQPWSRLSSLIGLPVPAETPESALQKWSSAVSLDLSPFCSEPSRGLISEAPKSYGFPSTAHTLSLLVWPPPIFCIQCTHARAHTHSHTHTEHTHSHTFTHSHAHTHTA